MIKARVVVAGCAVACAAACGQDGAVRVRVLLPQSSLLSPVSSQLARLTLVSESDGAPPQSTTRDVPEQPSGSFSFGDLPITAGVRLSLLGTTVAGKLVGYGRASVPIDVAADAEREVSILLRRPFTYVSGGPKLYVFDTTLEAGRAFVGTLDAAATPAAVATTPDGAEIIVVSGAQVALYSTGNHAKTGGAPVTIGEGARRLAVSPDGRWAVVLHAVTGKPTGVSVLDVEALRRGATSATFVEIDHAGAVAVADGAAYVLADPSVPGPPPGYVEDCSKPSRIVPVPLTSPRALSAYALAGAARDLAVAGDGETLLVAQPCQSAVVSVKNAGSSQVRVLSLPKATDVAVAGGRVWAVGQDGPANAVHLIVASAELDGKSPARLDLPATQELAESKDLTESGQAAEVRLDADRLDAFALSVLPDGRSVAILVHGSYHADAVVRPVDIFGIIYDETIVPRMDVDAYEYQLVDVGTGAVTQRLRTSCHIDWEKDKAVLDDWVCSSAGQGATTVDFVPEQAAVLYGGQ